MNLTRIISLMAGTIILCAAFNRQPTARAQDITNGERMIYLGIDSTDFKIMETEIRLAELEVRRTGFLNRIVPRIQFSAGMGINEIIFVDPGDFAPYLLPKDSYRLSVSISLNEILDFNSHERAGIRLAQLRLRHEQLKGKMSDLKSVRGERLAETDSLIRIASDELRLKEDLLNFKTISFRQGKVGYDELASSKLDRIGALRQLFILNQKRKEYQTDGK